MYYFIFIMLSSQLSVNPFRPSSKITNDLFFRLLQNNQISSLANGTFTNMSLLKYLYVFYGSKYLEYWVMSGYFQSKRKRLGAGGGGMVSAWDTGSNGPGSTLTWRTLCVLRQTIGSHSSWGINGYQLRTVKEN